MAVCVCCCTAADAADATNTAAEPVGATSELSRETTGTWLYIDGVKTPALAGMVFQDTEGSSHIRSYEYGHSLNALYKSLDEKEAGGKGLGARLEQMGIRAIRVYELPAEDADDAEKVKGIFRRLYDKHHIKVLIGDWAGLNLGMDYTNPQDLARLRSHLQKLAATYSGEAWVLGWQLGNENNYHIQNGRLGHEINLDAAGYYSFMDGLGGLMKEQLGGSQRRQIVTLGQGDLTEEEARLIGGMKNIDAVGINCYREQPAAFDELINLAAREGHLPIYFAEIGRPAGNAAQQEEQNQYLQHVCSAVFAEGAGQLGSGTVIGAFVHEATDEAWKTEERGEPGDAHFGVLGKSTEKELGDFLVKYDDFCTWVVPTNDAPDTLIKSAWQCLEGPYPGKHGRTFGHAMAYANRAITLYRPAAEAQQAHLRDMKSPPDRAAAPDFWALNTVGTGYFIIIDAWMLMSYDYKGFERQPDLWAKILYWSDFSQSQIMPPPDGNISPTNAAGCIYAARQVYASLQRHFPDAHLRDVNGSYIRLDHAMAARFPELSQPYLPLSWQNLLIFIGSGIAIILGFALISRWRASRLSVKTVPVMGPGPRFVFLLALVFNLASLYWFLNWWIHPVRLRYYTVQPAAYMLLSAIGALGILFYFCVWHLLWNMRRPEPMPATPGKRVAMVTTRVASEPVDALETTFEKMVLVTYPHDSYLLDEEDSPAARAMCERHGVIHFTRKGRPEYNEPSGKFQARTKGGNLNSWLYEYGGNYEFVTFLDPDHLPRPEFLDRVLGYFGNPNVAFVQAPPVYYNRADNWIARGAAEQSYFMYGPIMTGLFGIGACVVNGSHSTFRIADLVAMKGESYAVHDADDILTSMRLHALKKNGVYVPEVLAEGLAPDTWDEFSKQQRRWASSMFHLFFHHGSEHRGMPLRCKLVYFLMTSFYFRGVAFTGLLLLPFLSALKGNPPVNANVAGFCLRYLPFFLLHCGILLFLGQRYLIPRASSRGLWYRGGLLWVAMWWDHVCALWTALKTKKIKDRVVSAKWKGAAAPPWHAVRPHIVLALFAFAVFAWAWMRPDRRETTWGSLIFLGIIGLSQTFIILKVINTHKAPSRPPVRDEGHVPIATAYPAQLPES